MHSFSRGALVFVLFLALACTPREMRDAAESEWFLALPVCTSRGSLDTSGWRAVEAPRGELTLRVPPEFEIAPSTFIHGGVRWNNGEANLSLQYGHFSLMSFAPSATICRRVVKGMPVVEVTRASRGTSSAAWFVKSGVGTRFKHDIVVGLASPRPADAQVFETIVAAARR